MSIFFTRLCDSTLHEHEYSHIPFLSPSIRYFLGEEDTSTSRGIFSLFRGSGDEPASTPTPILSLSSSSTSSKKAAEISAKIKQKRELEEKKMVEQERAGQARKQSEEERKSVFEARTQAAKEAEQKALAKAKQAAEEKRRNAEEGKCCINLIKIIWSMSLFANLLWFWTGPSCCKTRS